jgi:hypothetical protein
MAFILSKTDVDPNGGTNYSISGTSQLLSVPFALYSKIAEKVTGSLDELDPDFNKSIAKGINAQDTAYWNKKLDNFIENDPLFYQSVAKWISAQDTAYWNHKLDSYTETDPIFNASIAKGITSQDTAYWNKKLNSYTETDPFFSASIAKGITSQDTAYWNKKLNSYTETDPVFNASVAKGITSQDTAYWNKKLNSYTETDPVFNASVAKGITSQDTAYWNKKLSSFTETDPLFNASIAKRISAQDTLYWNNKLDFEKDSSITNELQTLSISNDTIFLSDGGKVRIPITIKNAHINQDSLYVTFSDNKVKNVGYVGNGSPGSVLATVSTDTVQQFKYATASVKGSIVHGGNELIVGRGICYATTANPTLANFYQLSNDKTAIFIAHLSGLQPNTTYFARAFVTNTVGTAYGNSLSFKTLALTTPTLRTQGVFNVSHTTAMSNAVISDNGGSAILESGVCWSTSTNPTTASSKATSGTKC